MENTLKPAVRSFVIRCAAASCFLYLYSLINGIQFWWGHSGFCFGKLTYITRDEVTLVFTCIHGKRYGFKIQFDYSRRLHDLFGLRSGLRRVKEFVYGQKRP